MAHGGRDSNGHEASAQYGAVADRSEEDWAAAQVVAILRLSDEGRRAEVLSRRWSAERGQATREHHEGGRAAGTRHPPPQSTSLHTTSGSVLIELGDYPKSTIALARCSDRHRCTFLSGQALATIGHVSRRTGSRHL
jgi:hypothetical protein